MMIIIIGIIFITADLKSKLHERIWTQFILLHKVSAKLVMYNVIDVKLRNGRFVLSLRFINC